MPGPQSQNNHLLDMSLAILEGAADSVGDMIDVVTHPIQTLHAVSLITFDAANIAAHHLIQPSSIDSQALRMMHAESYRDSLARMKNFGDDLAQLGLNFLHASTTDQARMLSHVTTGVLLPGELFHAVKAMTTFSRNAHRFGSFTAPPKFAVRFTDDLPPTPTPWQGLTPEDVSRLSGQQKLLFVITEDMKLVIAHPGLKTPVMRKGRASFELHHHELGGVRPVYGAGELYVNEGAISKILPFSGHYLPDGPKLGPLIERTFVKHGYPQAKGRFAPLMLIGVPPPQTTLSTPLRSRRVSGISTLPGAAVVTLKDYAAKKMASQHVTGAKLENAPTATDLATSAMMGVRHYGQSLEPTIHVSPETGFDALHMLQAHAPLLLRPASRDEWRHPDVKAEGQSARANAAPRHPALPKQQAYAKPTMSRAEYDALKNMPQDEYDAMQDWHWKAQRDYNGKIPTHDVIAALKKTPSAPDRVSMEEYDALGKQRYDEWRSRNPPKTLDKIFFWPTDARLPYERLADHLKKDWDAKHPPEARSTPFPDAGISHQAYVDPRGASIGSDTMFLSDADLPYSRENTEALLAKSLQNKQIPTAEAKQKASTLTDKIFKNHNQRTKTGGKDPVYQAARQQLLEEIRIETDSVTFESLQYTMPEFEKTIDEARQLHHDFVNKEGQFAALAQPILDEKALGNLQVSIDGLKMGFQTMAMVGLMTNSPEFVKASQAGIGLMDVATRVTEILSMKFSEMGAMAITGNFIGLGMSILSLVFPFLNFSQGPTPYEIIFDYLKQLTGHLDARLDFIDNTLKLIRDDIHYLIDLAKANYELLKRLGTQLYNFQQLTQYTLDVIQSLLIGIHDTMNEGFDLLSFEKFRSTLRELEDVLTQATPAHLQRLPILLEELHGNYVLEMSQTRYHTNAVIAERALQVPTLTPADERIYSSKERSKVTRLDEVFMTHKARHDQAILLDRFFNKCHDSQLLFGFQATYAQALLADELKTLSEINMDIQKLIKGRLDLESQRQAIENSLRMPMTDASDLETTWRQGQLNKLFLLKNELADIEIRLSTLSEIQLRKIFEQEQQNNRVLATKQQERRLSERAESLLQIRNDLKQNITQLNMTVDEEISAYQALEAVEFDQLVLDQLQRHFNVSTHRANIRTQPSFQVFNIPVAIAATEAWLKGLAHPSLNETYHQRHLPALYQTITLLEKGLGFIGFIQKQPNLPKKLWLGYKTSVLFFHDFYEKGYAAHRDQLPPEAIAKHQREAKLNPKYLRVGEKAFIKKLLEPGDALNTLLKQYLLIVDIQKKLLTDHGELVGAPQALQHTLAALPAQHGLLLELQQAFVTEEPAYFTQDTLYERLNQGASHLATTLFRPGYVLPEPEMTPMGARIAATLGRVYQRLYLSTTYSNRTDELIKPRSNPMPPRKETTSPEKAPDQRHSSQLSFLEMMQQTTRDGDLGCIEPPLWIIGMTDTSKTALTAAIVGCKLNYVPNPDPKNTQIPYFVEIESCPPGVTPPELGNKDRSETIRPTVYRRGGDHPVAVVDNAGMLNTRPNMRLFTMMLSQYGIQKTKGIRGIPLTVPVSRLEDIRGVDLREDLEALATMFKHPLNQYQQSLHLVITKFKKGKPPSKTGIIHQLEKILRAANEDAAKDPSIENTNFAQLVAFFTSTAGQNNIVAFDPSNPTTLDAWIASARQQPIIPTSELTLAGTEEDKMAFMSEYKRVLTDHTAVLKTVVETRQTITKLEHKESYLKDWLEQNKPAPAAENTQAPTETAEQKKGEVETTQTPLEQMQVIIDAIDEDIDATKQQLDALDLEQTGLTDKATALSNRKELVSVDIIVFDEKALYGSKHPGMRVDELKKLIASDRNDQETRNAIAAIHREGLSSSAYSPHKYVMPPHKGEPYTHIEYKGLHVPCPLGRGELSMLTEEKANPPEGTYSVTIQSSDHCDDHIEIHLQRPYNEQVSSVLQMQIWDTKFEDNRVKISQLRAHLIARSADKFNHEAKRGDMLLLQEQQRLAQATLDRQEKHEDFQAKQRELSETEAALRTARATSEQAEAVFLRDQPVFQNIEIFDQGIGVETEAGKQFHALYVAALKQMNQNAQYPAITRCTPDVVPPQLSSRQVPPVVPKVQPPTTLEKAEASLRNSIFGGEKGRPIRVDIATRPMCLPAEKPQGNGFFSCVNRAFQWAGNATWLMSTAQCPAPIQQSRALR